MTATVTRNALAAAYHAAEELHVAAVRVAAALDTRSRQPAVEFGPGSRASLRWDLAELDAYLADLKRELTPYTEEPTQ